MTEATLSVPTEPPSVASELPQSVNSGLSGGQNTSAAKAVGWSSVLRRPTQVSRNDGVRPSTAQPAVADHNNSSGNHDNPTAPLLQSLLRHQGKKEASDARQIPNEAIFNTQFTTAGRMFLTKVKKNRAMQVDRRTKGFQQGIDEHTVLTDPITKRHYRILILDPDMQRREDLADGLEHFFEILVAPSNERALALLSMFKVDLILLRVGFGNDNSATSSPALAFLREMKKKFVHTPVSAMVPPASEMGTEMQKLLQRALTQGACGYFEDDVSIPTFVKRLGKLLHSLVVAQSELVQCRGISHAQNEQADDVLPVQAIKKRDTTVSLVKRPATSKPDSVTYDQSRMMLELSLNQRKQCILQRQALTEALDNQHSVLGVELTLSASASTGLIGLASSAPSLRQSVSSPGRGGFFPPDKRSSARSTSSLTKKIPPLPSQKEISKRIYAKPHEIQEKIHKHLYETYHTSKHDAIPQDPLLHHCIAIDPQSISKSAGKSLLVAKAFFLYKEQRYEEALLQSNRAIKMQGNNLVKLAFLLRGVLFDIGGHYTKAEHEFRTCLKLDPNLHQAHFNLSVSLLKMGKDEQALQEISLALQFNPANEQYLRNRALIYRRMGNFALAQSEYTRLESLPGATAGAALLISSSAQGGTLESALNKCDMRDGLFDHLFGKPTEEKLALVCPPRDRTPAMVDAIVALLQTVLFFQDFPTQVLTKVAEHMEYEVVTCGKCFTLGEDHPQNFYVVLHGKISVRRKFGDFASSVTTHHMDKGMTFGCTGHAVSLHSQLIADESTEVGILWPDAYDLSIRSFCSQRNSEIFKFLEHMKAFRHFSTSELGHIIGISERKRFRKGEVILEQNETPKYLCILWKGTCLMYQDFKKPPLSSGTGSDGDEDNLSDSSGDDDDERVRSNRTAKLRTEEETKVLPFHRFIAKPDWPLDFESHARKLKSRKHARARRNALSGGVHAHVWKSPQRLDSMLKIPPSFPEKLKSDEKHALIKTLVAPAIFGESTFLNQEYQRSKWCVCVKPLCHLWSFSSELIHCGVILMEFETARSWPIASSKCCFSITCASRKWIWRRK